ncbi:hypothetical protein GUJ93_ZPchr0009g1686 [Zizania palustris]|uniref:Aminotransferase-like plant mobile domain-containing protein n=1 Tax=Zizania palustris TaxID=103762 RepID=A0A8J5S5V0_ZIZPA|nr:hypothetical protein GUJ93_ZPchr0009g1686 [Zizania palustris]
MKCYKKSWLAIVRNGLNMPHVFTQMTWEENELSDDKVRTFVGRWALAFFLMNHIRDKPLSIVVGSKVLPINAAAVHAVLGIPIGGVKCFMMAVFNALLFPTSVLNINGSDFLYCKEIMRMGEFDWCQAVVDDIRDKVDRWRKNRDKATPLVQGCIAFIMLRERIGSCYANIGDGPGGQGHVLEYVTSSAGFLYGKAAGIVKIHPAAKAKRDHTVKEKGVKHHDKHRSPSADDNTKRSKSKGQSTSKTMEYRHISYGFLHLQPLLRGLGYSLNTESPRDIRRKRRAERPLGGSSLNVKRKSQIPREVSPEHIDSGDDCPEIVVERSPQLSAGQSSFEQQEAAHAPSDTHVQHEVEQTVTIESVHEEQIILFENYTSESQYDENTVPSLLDERLKAHDLLNASLGPSLELFELLASGKTEHNVIEGTQQIIDSSDATKVGVASCDVEKDDVASRDE